MLTAAERIAQIATARNGGVIPSSRPVANRERLTREPATLTTVDPLASRSLPGTWKKHPDSWDSDCCRRAMLRAENRLCGFAVARLLGEDWRYQVRDDHNNTVEVVHRDGYGFSIGRQWNDSERFRVAPLHRYRTDDGLPSEITINASRPFGAIAADIKRRIIDADLKAAHDQCTESDNTRRAEVAERFAALSAVAAACRGHFARQSRWKGQDRPMVMIPGGEASIGYTGQVEFDIELTPNQAVEIAKKLSEISKELPNY